MKVTRKGQVTIPQAIRGRAGMSPGTEAEFYLDEAGRVRLEPSPAGRASEVAAAVRASRGRAGQSALSTEEIMALTRR